MPLNPGTRIGPYKIVAPIGAGGMGEVYRARDTKLNRDVALKILPDAFAGDPDRLARFTREAQTLAALNDPHIAHIHGLEEANGIRALAMEFVDGEDLAERLRRGPIPLDEALAIARQIIDGLEAAHDQAIVHRDLKPANIKVTPDGVVKILDFGLAKAIDPTAAASGAGALSYSPTITSPAMTAVGMILGTAAYMSPEQARGKAVDRRTDVWAFGCVLFEMLTGRPPFEGEDVVELIGALVHREPDWATLPAATPPLVRLALDRCLEKNPKKRIRDVGDVRLLLDGAFGSAAARAAPQPPIPSRRPLRTGLIAGGFAVAVLLTTIGAWAWASSRERPPQVSRFGIVPPPTLPLNFNAPDRPIAISGDGSHIVYRGGIGTAGTGQMFVRAIDQLDARPVTLGVGGFRDPALSPDGRWIAFHPRGELRKISTSGGPSITLCRTVGAPRGTSWGTDGTIVFATDDLSTGLLSVPAAGGEPKVLTKPDTARGESDHLFPFILPGSAAVLFTIRTMGTEGSQVAVLDLKTGQQKVLIRGGSQAEYVEPGYLVYAAGSSLRAVRFDVKRLEVASDAVPVVDEVLTQPSGGPAAYDVSSTGTLVYVPGSIASTVGAQRSLVWVDRQGKEDAIKAPTHAYTYPRLSPDGTRLAIDVRDQDQDIWIWHLARETLTRLTFDPGLDTFPVWSPDSRRIIFSSQRAGGTNLFAQSADGTGAVERLTTSPNQQEPVSFAPGGASLAFRETVAKTGQDIFLLTLKDKPSAQPLIQTTFTERNPEISPDGRWIAYESNESGMSQIYVRPFPQVDSGRWQVSTAGGTRPLWARNGKELFYLNNDGQLMSAALQTTGQTFNAGNPVKLLENRYWGFNSGNSGRTYDVSQDGRHFLMIKDNAGTDPRSTATPASMVVVLNWAEELKRIVTAK